jgi:hypothetical protein
MRDYKECEAKGKLGEEIVLDCIDSGLIGLSIGQDIMATYKHGDERHPIDFYLSVGEFDGLVGLEVKTQEQLVHGNWRGWTGVFKRHYEVYEKEASRIPVYIAFVDCLDGTVRITRMGETITRYMQKPPRVLWKASEMKVVYNLNKQEIDKLKSLTNINPKYRKPETKPLQRSFVML